MTITEQGLLPVKAGQEAAFEAALRDAVPLIARQPGFVGIRVSRGVESPSIYLLLVEWESVEAHEEGFRKSADFELWRTALHPFYETRPTIEHFTQVATA